ncbi:retrovirus-related Pol polyprotein from transposon opus [Nephila pilipes]|uniref:Retrovirus-related Pol polyprotein from transposon opus n=1 Tax=Nephila pilipes TaxID=299642 RepID=A0A8X6UKB3_NEPPI|nr:retrovirus-related Pol polyprotein from transposon opus [Nephila pilipes]
MSLADGQKPEVEVYTTSVVIRLEGRAIRTPLIALPCARGNRTFLGMDVLQNDAGSRPLPEKVEAIINYKLPSTIHDLRTFLGLINFYQRYLKDAAETQAPLHELLKGMKKKAQRKVPWTDDTRRNFEKCKTGLMEAALL